MNSSKPLPHFRYHPDPIATGSIERSDAACRSCGQQLGVIYAGPVYSVEELDDAICPWCIADGSAHNKFSAEFVDAGGGIGGYGKWEAVPASVVEEVAYRTPGFNGWQQERWFTHCGDAAEFLAIVGKTELEAFGIEAIDAIRQESGYEGEDWESYYNALNGDDGPTAYIFRCRHCGKLGGYSDCH